MPVAYLPKWVATIVLGSALILDASTAQAQELKLPRTLTFTAYDTGTSGFNIAVAVGKMLKDKHGTEVRVLPAGNDVARLAPLRAGRSQISAMGVGVYYAQEGLFEFGAKDWGPQPLQVLLSSIDCNGLLLGVARDTGIKELKELKGKRVGFVVGAPSLNQNALSILAFAGLGRNDVKIVEFAVNNDVDAAFASTLTAPAKEVETSPRGIIWPPLHHADKAGWERVQQVGPYFTPIKATCGAAITAATPIELGAYPYPIFTAYASQPEELIYCLTKAMIADFDARMARPARPDWRSRRKPCAGFCRSVPRP
jgi:TRAP transporter TAXI family solute receptor